MSGVAAVIDRGAGEVAPDAVSAMLDAIEHRGPDGRGTWIDDRVGLGHQQLQTTPQARFDDQPHVDDGVVVAADLRLDNREELLAALPTSTDPARLPDSQLVAAAYREWGEHCVDRLIGAFAFVLWDADRQRALCARDHFGAKPLYYYRTDDAFAVASEPKALLALPAVPPRLDETRVGDFLTEQFEDKENAIYEPIRRLPPAHATTVDPDRTEQWQYWELDPTRTVTLGSDAAYERRFRERFERAVRARLRTDDDVGTTLSGGLDSSAVTGVARQELDDDRSLYTYTGVFEESESCDERAYAEQVAARDGVEPTYVNVDALSPVGHFDDALAYQDEPIHNSMDYMNWALTERAAGDGVRVLLEGTHGDSVVDYGLGLLPELLRTGRWRHLARELRAMGDVLGRSPRDLFVGRALAPLIPGPVTRAYRRVRGRPVDREQSNPAVDPAFADRVGLWQRVRDLERTGSVLRRSGRRWQYRSLLTGNMTAYLEANDRTLAAFGLEPRYPFLDPRLVEFSLAIPQTQQLKDGWTRSILRRALGDVLPDDVQWRPWKTTLNESFERGLARERDQLERYALENEALDPYLERDALARAYDEFTREPNPRDASVLWRAFALARWFERNDVRR